MLALVWPSTESLITLGIVIAVCGIIGYFVHKGPFAEPFKWGLIFVLVLIVLGVALRAFGVVG